MIQPWGHTDGEETCWSVAHSSTCFLEFPTCTPPTASVWTPFRFILPALSPAAHCNCEMLLFVSLGSIPHLSGAGQPASLKVAASNAWDSGPVSRNLSSSNLRDATVSLGSKFVCSSVWPAPVTCISVPSTTPSLDSLLQLVDDSVCVSSLNTVVDPTNLQASTMESNASWKQAGCTQIHKCGSVSLLLLADVWGSRLVESNFGFLALKTVTSSSVSWMCPLRCHRKLTGPIAPRG